MSYRVVPLTNLMAYEFGQTEADFHYLSESDVSSILLNQKQSLEQLKDELRHGHAVLLSSSPSIPLLVYEEDEHGILAWRVSDAATQRLTLTAQRALNARAQLTGQALPRFTPSLSPSLPLAEYRPEPVVPPTPEKTLPLNYEYCFDIACGLDTLEKSIRLDYMLGTTRNEPKITHWQATPLEPDRTRITLLGRVDEPKPLHIHISERSLRLSTTLSSVKMRQRGTHIASEGFIPIQPAIKLGERLGFPTKGVFYHFHHTKLIQEYRIKGNSSENFYVTMTYYYGHNLNPERRLNADMNTLLVYWKIEGQLVDNQYLVYLEHQIPQQTLETLDEQWLSDNGVKLDIAALLDVTREETLPREFAIEPKPEPYNTHCVMVVPETGQRETWMAIAEQYGITPRNLLDMNPQFNSDTQRPTDLKVGDVLHVDLRLLHTVTPLKSIKTHGTPPQSPRLYNAPLNSHYEYNSGYKNGKLIEGSDIVAMRKNSVYSDIPIVCVKEIFDMPTQTQRMRNLVNWDSYYDQIKHIHGTLLFDRYANYGAPNVELSSHHASTFTYGQYRLIKTQRPTRLYRVYDPSPTGEADEFGTFWTTDLPINAHQALQNLAILPEWWNNASRYVCIEVPAGTLLYVGTAAPQNQELLGGGVQVIIYNKDKNRWIEMKERWKWKEWKVSDGYDVHAGWYYSTPAAIPEIKADRSRPSTVKDLKNVEMKTET